MEKYDIHASIASYADAGFSAVAIYLTVITGYLIAAFLVGSKLTKSQLLIISAIFVTFSLFLTFGSYAFFSAALGVDVPTDPDWVYRVGVIVPPLFCSLQILGIFAAIKFMMDIRKNINV